jgi:hypothetical protein
MWFRVAGIKIDPGTFIVLNQSLEISSPKLVTSQGKDITKGIQSKFVYQFAFPNYYELI